MTKRKAMVIVTVVCLLLWVFILEPNALEVRNYWIEDANLDKVKVAFLTDFNLKKGTSGYNRLKKIVNETIIQKPDIVLLGGDFVYGGKLSETMNINTVAEQLANIKVATKASMIAVLGDDDWNTGESKAIADALRKNKIHVLNNSMVKVPAKGKIVYIAGVLDKAKGYPNITKALSKTRQPRILLSHNPDIYYDVMENVSVILAGHTHGGRVILPYMPALFVSSKFGSKFASGLINETNNKMIISKGLGTVGTDKLRIRFRCKPEIVIVNFCKRGTCQENPK